MNLSTARSSLHSQLLDATGETISVFPSGDDGPYLEIIGLRGQNGTETHNTAMQGYRVTAQYVDWLIAASETDYDYVPESNDIIEDADGNQYRVVADQNTSRVWRWSSAQHKVLRIHTKPEDQR